MGMTAWTELSLGFWKQEFKNPSLEKVGVKTEKLEFDQKNLSFSQTWNFIFLLQHEFCDTLQIWKPFLVKADSVSAKV